MANITRIDVLRVCFRIVLAAAFLISSLKPMKDMASGIAGLLDAPIDWLQVLPKWFDNKADMEDFIWKLDQVAKWAVFFIAVVAAKAGLLHDV